VTTSTTITNRFPAKVAVNVISPGIIATEMKDRFTGGTEAGRQAVSRRHSSGAWGRPRRSPPLSRGCAPRTFAIGHALVVDGGQAVEAA
jgi:NAD(P)-dependent dehydrogenase (short-subunit alcohol dehydrogenase family)